MIILLILSLLCFSSLGAPTSVSHHTFSLAEDATGWVYFEVDHIDCITSITWYKEMQHILYPPKDYEPFVYYTRDAEHVLASPIGLNTKEVPAFWTHNRAYILITKNMGDRMEYDVVMLINSHPISATTKQTTVGTTAPETTTPKTTTIKTTTTEVAITETTAPDTTTLEVVTTETTAPDTTTLEVVTTETTAPDTTTLEVVTTETTAPDTTTLEVVTTEVVTTQTPSTGDVHDVKSANTPAVHSPSNEFIAHKSVAIILLSAFVVLFIVVLVILTARSSSAIPQSDGNDFFEKHKKDDDDFVVVDQQEDTREKDMQILMALGKGAKPSFSANL